MMSDSAPISAIEVQIKDCLANAKVFLSSDDLAGFKAQSDLAFEAYLAWVRVGFNVAGDNLLKPLIAEFRSLKKDYSAVHGLHSKTQHIVSKSVPGNTTSSVS